MTNKIYLEDTYQFHFESLVQEIAEDKKGIFIILDRSAFYPQGGGQPSDLGIIKSDNFEINIIHVAQFNDEVRHYITSSDRYISIGSAVHGFIDQARRLLNASYHTASHLLGNITELFYPKLKAIKAHSFPGEAYIEFQGNEEIDSKAIQNMINQSIAENYKIKTFEIDHMLFEQQFYKLPYNIPVNKKFRAIQIFDMPPIPCGGTHLSSLCEMEYVKINKIKAKNSRLCISYEVK